MTETQDRAAKQMARFVVLYDTPSDVDAFGEPCYMVAMLDWDDMAALEAARGSEIGQRTAEDAAANLARYATFRGMILQLDEV